MNKKHIVSACKGVIIIVLQCMAAIQVLILIGTSPVLFDKLSFNVLDYLEVVVDVSMKIYTLQELTFEGVPLFPIVMARYADTMKILGAGIATAFVLSSLNAYIALLVFRRRLRQVIKALDVFEAIPDVMIIVLLQIGVIAVYKSTGIKLAQVVTVGSQDQTILLPILCISIPVSFFLTKVLIQYVLEELDKRYILLARSMGFSFFYILNVHVIRNITDALFGVSKTIFYSMLSTLMVVEYLFNLNGLLSLVFSTSNSEVFSVSCIVLFVPFFILYRTYDGISSFIRKEKM
ncbi:ABC transporter permease subunit [Bacillus sp. F19]|nr:ABC transporter permease subunit [Bacillus sp. F19]